jgi:hypothetical protein
MPYSIFSSRSKGDDLLSAEIFFCFGKRVRLSKGKQTLSGTMCLSYDEVTMCLSKKRGRLVRHRV